VAGSSMPGNAGVAVGVDGSPKMGFSPDSAVTEGPVAVGSVDEDWKKLNLGVAVDCKGFVLVANGLLLPKDISDLVGSLEAPNKSVFGEVLVAFSNGFVEGVVEVSGTPNGFAEGVNAVEVPKLLGLEVESKTEENWFGFVEAVESVVSPVVLGLALVLGISSSEWSVMKSESLPGSSRTVVPSLDESSTMPFTAASDAVTPFMTAERVRSRRLLSTRLREKSCFRREDESATIVRSIDHTPKLKSWTIPHLIKSFPGQNPNLGMALRPPFVRWQSHVLHRSSALALLRQNLELVQFHSASSLPSLLILHACRLSISIPTPFSVRG